MDLGDHHRLERLCRPLEVLWIVEVRSLRTVVQQWPARRLVVVQLLGDNQPGKHVRTVVTNDLQSRR